MSHVVTIKCELRDLAAIEAACKRLGWTFKRDQKTFEWFGEWMNDYAAADGGPDEALTATLSDGGNRVGSLKNGIGGGSSTDRNNDGHDANGDCHPHHHPHPCRAATAIGMMTMGDERGARRRRGNCRARTR